ncbi:MULTISPECIES: type IV-A pilus assembly ATPase PilB [unclassified Wenzhouxiangella]|uniref:type IV-A pilus assembly ATPase PilB n=1 Tax=unclassified Wenzhouxiangella TaxID=2613841 RepID=UPI000E329863|nr:MULTISPECIES: type IV-A pilus assembly ATPase PilB [unclassified Wenzhouxiangella]RFF27791.1 type IV-A pilus assembly ATPase PilB [Wenzhouxiangella sp. 15181]RFP70366.1 type IV-A pilus assembly ATPase PilB [Wenzhouxiangella sp. 15190]
MPAQPASIMRLPTLGRKLVEAGLLTEDKALQVAEKATEKGRTFTSHVVREKAVDAMGFAHLAAEDFGMPLVDLAAVNLKHAPVDMVSEDLVRKHLILPIMKRGKRLFVAVADPGNKAGIDEIAFSTGLAVEAILAPYSAIEPAMDRALAGSAQAFTELTEDEDDLDNLKFDSSEQQEEDSSDAAGADEAPVVRFVNKVLVDAIRKGASDIHFEPYEDEYRVRFRVDGVLVTQVRPPRRMAPRLSARLKVMASLDIAERRVPQDGRIKLNVSKGSAYDFRVSTCPTLWGEKIVLRILDSSGAFLGPEKLGFEQKQQDDYLAAISKPYGMVLVTGPTGSGKTVTLYTALGILNDEGRNISTVEDPVEIRMKGVNQVQQNVKQGLTFAAALRSFLRQDPDIIMVGEIRDLETAEIAIKAAQTGHLVLSTLHTNDAPASVARLMNMGVPSYNIVSTVHLVLAQRLARTLHSCKKPEEVPDDALLKLGFTEEEVGEGIKVYQAGGCDQCTGGYKGRSGVFQVMPISEEMEQIILEGGGSLELEKQSAEDGVIDLRRAALNKVKGGKISLAEMNRVTKD